jgi:hypothetical protein
MNNGLEMHEKCDMHKNSCENVENNETFSICQPQQENE